MFQKARDSNSWVIEFSKVWTVFCVSLAPTHYAKFAKSTGSNFVLSSLRKSIPPRAFLSLLNLSER